MSDLPWDRFQPDPVEPELPYVPPALTPLPIPVQPLPPVDLPPQPLPTPPTTEPSPDVKDLATDLLHEAMDYAKEVISGTFKGQDIDITHPTITATTAAGKELVIADAKSRSWRTLIQGLAFDVIAAIIASIAMLTGMDPLVKDTWIAFGVLLLKSVVSAVISYFMRLHVTPTIKTEGEKMNIMPLVVPKPEKDSA